MSSNIEAIWANLKKKIKIIINIFPNENNNLVKLLKEVYSLYKFKIYDDEEIIVFNNYLYLYNYIFMIFISNKFLINNNLL